MLNTKERVAAVKERTLEINNKERRRKGIIISLSSLVASILLIVGLSFVMPRIMGRLSEDSYTYPGLSASFFDGSDKLGYLMIALLAFALGVCVTILSYRIHLRNKEEEEK